MITVVANLKGGSGKSTVVFNLGLWLQNKGQPVAAYDLDPQQTLSDVAEVRREEGYAPPLQVYNGEGAFAEQLRIHPGQVRAEDRQKTGIARPHRPGETRSGSDLRLSIPVRLGPGREPPADGLR